MPWKRIIVRGQTLPASTYTDNQPTPCPLHVQAQLLLGQTHLNNGCFSEAFSYFEAAARSHHPVALNMLGRAYERGWGVPRNPQQAALCFEHAAEHGEGWAMFNLADLLYLGDGIPQDQARAYRLYAASAGKGNAKALNMLGVLHEQGITGTADKEGAKTFFEAAAEAGDCWAELNLARLALESGHILDAEIYLKRALKNGFSDIYHAIIALISSYDHFILKAIHREAAEAIRKLE